MDRKDDRHNKNMLLVDAFSKLCRRYIGSLFQPSFPPPWLIAIFKSILPYVATLYLFMFYSTSIFSIPKAWASCVVAVSVLNSGRSIGQHIDSVVLSLVGLGLGALSGFAFIYIAEHPALHPDVGLALGLIVLYFSLAWFAYFRTFSLRFFGFALNAIVYPCIGVFSASILGIQGSGYMGLIQPCCGYLLGTALSIVFNLLVFPVSAHSEFRQFLMKWNEDLKSFSSTLLRGFAGTFSPQEAEELETLLKKLEQCVPRSDMLLNQALSEPSFSKLSTHVLIDIVKQFKSLTQIHFSIYGGFKLYHEWLESEPISPFRDSFRSLDRASENISNLLNVYFDQVRDRLQYQRMEPLGCPRGLLRGIQELQAQQRVLLDYIHRRHYADVRQNYDLANAQDWDNPQLQPVLSNMAKLSENILSFYSFPVILEELANSIILVNKKLDDAFAKRRVLHIPFVKWIPFWLFTLPKRLLSKKYLYSEEKGRFCVKKALHSLTKFLMSADCVFAFKMATCVTLFCVLYLHSSTREFFVSSNLSGTIINIAILVSPTFGQSFSYFIIQISGYLIGAASAVLTYTVIGPRPVILWLPVAVYAGRQYGLRQSQPKHTDFVILSLISFANTSFACWNQLHGPDSGKTLFMNFVRAVMVALIGLGFASIFTLIIFPRFAKHELGQRLAAVFKYLNELQQGVYDAPDKAARETLKYHESISQDDSRTDDHNAQAIKIDPSYIMKQLRQDQGSLSNLASKIQSEIIRLNGLIEHAAAEPNLSGPFPKTEWSHILKSVQIILSRLRGAIFTLDHPWSVEIRVAHIWLASRRQREDVLAAIHLLFYVYEGSTLIQQPLPSQLPSALKMREQIVQQAIKTLLQSSIGEQYPIPLPVRTPEIQTPNRSQISDSTIISVEDTDQLLWDRSEPRTSPSSASNTTTLFQEPTHELPSEFQDAGQYALHVFYYAYIFFSRGAVAETDQLGAKLKNLFGERSR